MSSQQISTINLSRRFLEVLNNHNRELSNLGIGYSANSTKAASVVVPAAQTAPVPSVKSPRNSVSSLASQFNNTSLAPARSNSIKSPPAPPTPASPPPPAYGLAEAEGLYDYNPQDEGDLRIRVGQRIAVLEYGIPLSRKVN
jgi:hypothetical protein